MDSPSLPQNPAESSPDVVLTDAEWQEVSDCGMALHAAIYCCDGLEGDEPAELVKSVQIRFEAALTKIRKRLWPSD